MNLARQTCPGLLPSAGVYALAPISHVFPPRSPAAQVAWRLRAAVRPTRGPPLRPETGLEARRRKVHTEEDDRPTTGWIIAAKPFAH